jgi:hypothetical protein
MNAMDTLKYDKPFLPPIVAALNDSGTKLIFTVTTGRSGTELLQRLFSLLPGVTSVHEPEPKFSRVLRQAQENQSCARDFLLNLKLPEIARCTQSFYVETSHLFCKGFLKTALQLGLRFDLVVLRRPARDVARSLYELDTIPARTEWGRSFLLAPSDPGVLPLPHWETMHDYQLCYWYCLEIERRAIEYAELVAAKGGRVSTASLADLLEGRFPHILDNLKIPLPSNSNFVSRMNDVVSSPVNAKRDIKSAKAKNPIDDYEILEEAVLARVDSSFANQLSS